MKRNEQKYQTAIFKYLNDLMELQKYSSLLAFSIPNEGKRSERQGKTLKNMGLMPGAADMCLLFKGGRVCFVELKVEKRPLSDNQEIFAERVKRLGFNYRLIRADSEKEAVDKIEQILKDYS